VSIDDQFASLFREFGYRVKINQEDRELVGLDLIARAYALGYHRHAEMFGQNNELMCRNMDNMNTCEGGPLGPNHRCKFPPIF
jgi:hypothetical protein